MSENGKKVTAKGPRLWMVALILIVFLIVGAVVNSKLSSRQEEELIKLERVEELLNEEKTATADVPADELNTLLEETRQSPVKFVREKSLFISGQRSYAAEDYQKAADYFSLLVKDYKNSYLADQARLNLAAANEALNNNNAALALYKEVSAKKKSLFWAEATFNAARLEESSNADEAVSLYRMLSAELKEENIWRKLAENRLIFMGKL